MYSKAGNGIQVHVKGTPYEQGKTQGELAAPLILKNVNSINQKLENMKMSKAEYSDLVMRNLKFYEKHEPQLVEELHGIADGSQIPFEDIVKINLPLFFVINWLSQECTSILTRGSATLGGKTYLVKNRDMGGEKVEHIILHREYESGEKIVEVNGAGIITFPGNGLNSHGLALSTSGTWSEHLKFDLSKIDDSHIMLNSHLILEKCRNVDEALDYLRTEKRMSGMNFILCDKNRAVAAEVTQDGLQVLEDNNGILVRSNHYISTELQLLNSAESANPSSFKRYDHATEYLTRKHGQIQFQDMLEIASDHSYGHNNSLCRHEIEGQRGSSTVYTSIIVLEDWQIWTAISHPCEALKLVYV